MKEWKQIYESNGPVQTEPSEQVIKLAPIFRNEDVKRILDHGCGTGRHVKYLAEQGFFVVGTDYSFDALDIAEESVKGLNAELIQSEMDSIPYSDGYFDAVISNHTVQHALKDQIDRAFYEISRTLKNKGLLFLRTVSRKHKVYGKGNEIEPHTFADAEELPDGKSPHHYFSEEEVRGYLDRFDIINLEHHSFPPDPNGYFKHGLEEWAVLARKK